MNFKILMVLAILLLLAGCGNADNKVQILSKMLDMDEVEYNSIMFENDAAIVNYEASSADAYDDKIISDWASILGSASEFDIKRIIIINDINGVATAKIITTKENVEDFFSERINESVFWENVEIKSIE